MNLSYNLCVQLMSLLDLISDITGYMLVLMKAPLLGV